MMVPERQVAVRRLVIQRLESLQRAGVTDLLRVGRLTRRPRVVPTSEAPETPEPTATSYAEETPVPNKKSTSAASTQTQKSLQLDAGLRQQPVLKSRTERVHALETLAGQVARCCKCLELCENRTQTVFGTGDPEARLVFLGEAPGADEDRQGEPFVGRAGQLLNKIIQACTLKR